MSLLYKSPFFDRLIGRVITPLFLSFKSVQFSRLRCIGFPIVYVAKNASISFGDLCTVFSTQSTFLGVNHRSIFRAISPYSQIKIGDCCGFSGATIVATTSITIGNNCLIGANTIIVDSDFHYLSHTQRIKNNNGIPPGKKILIGSNVFIGMNCIILKGVSIGNDSVIGAGSVVSHDIPPKQIWAGNPASFIKSLE